MKAKFLAVMLFFFLVFNLSNATLSYAITLYMNNEIIGMSDEVTAWTPTWELINEGPDTISFGSNGNVTLSAILDWGDLPIDTTGRYFSFSPSVLDGYTLHSGESIGSIHGMNITPPLLPVTYDVAWSALFEIGGDFLPGSGSSLLTLNLLDNTGAILDSEAITLSLLVEDISPGMAREYNTNVPTSSAPVPEPATMLLFGIGLLGLAGVSRRKK
jgi:hypothetical protein